MTNVTFEKTEGQFVGFSFIGHACFSEGPDILCSALSMASQMTCNGLESVSDNVDCTIDDGCLKVNFEKDASDIRVQVLVQSLHDAVKNLYEQYPAFITLSYVERSE